MSYQCFAEYGNKLFKSIETIEETLIEEIKKELYKRMDGQSEIFLIGNGGSAANAYHIAGDYLKTFSILGKRLKINCLSDNGCFLTAASNDLDYSEVYEVLIDTRITKKDFLIFFSGSGNSMNLVKSARAAKHLGIKTAAVLGYKGGALLEIVDIPIHVSVQDMEIAEDCQIALFHYIKQCLYNKIIKGDNISDKYKKRTSEDLIA